jgi:hypothetical protein
MSNESHATDGIQELSAAEMDAVAGGSMMDIVMRAWDNLTKDCLRRLTREGTVIDCRYPARL